MLRIRKTPLAAVVAVVICGSVLVAVTSSATPGTADPQQDTITQMAGAVAKANGEPAPTNIQWVRADRAAIAKLLSFGIPDTEAGQQEILIQFQGDFTASTAPVPPGGKTPTGTVMDLVVDAATMQGTDASLRQAPLDLSTVGAVSQAK